MSAIGNMKHTQEYLYDFAVDGGGTGEIVLSDKAGMPNVPVGSIVKRVYATVLTAFTSGGSATLAWGNGDDPDGYSGTAIAVASLVVNASFNGQETPAAPGALIYDNIATTPDAVKENGGLVVTDAAKGQVSVTIATAAMTAGKMALQVEFYAPGQAE